MVPFAFRRRGSFLCFFSLNAQSKIINKSDVLSCFSEFSRAGAPSHEKASYVKCRAILTMNDAFLFDTCSENTYIHIYAHTAGWFLSSVFSSIHVVLYAEERVTSRFDSSDAVFLRAFGDGDANRSRDVAEFVYCFREDASYEEIFSSDFFG